MKPVICSYCNTQIYNYIGPADRVEAKAKNFVPASPNFKAPEPGQDIVCPNCAIKFVGVSNQDNQLKMLIDWHYKGSGDVGTL